MRDGVARAGRIGAWVAVAVGMITAAALLRPARLIPTDDPRVAEYRDVLVAGFTLVRGGLVAGAILAIASGLFWRRGVGRHERIRLGARDIVCAAIPLLLFCAIAIPHLGDSLQWDELGSLNRVARRGPTVILTFASAANNHILNSLGLWVTLNTIGESEAKLHLIPFALGAMGVLVVWWGVRPKGRVAATIAAATLAGHIAFVNHTTEARGYAGATTFAVASCFLFAGLLRGGGRGWTAAYIMCAVAACGFVATTVLVPAAHGLVAIVVYVRRPSGPGRVAATNAVFACLWVGVVAAVCFGVPIPQVLDYARTRASYDHLPVGVELAAAVVHYLTAAETVGAGLFLLGVAGYGWWQLRSDGDVAAAFLFPIAATVGYVLLPGSHASPRFFSFLLATFTVGFGVGVVALTRCGWSGWIVAAAAISLFVWQDAMMLARFWSPGRPDVRHLATTLAGERVALTGLQADVNLYYFSDALAFRTFPSAGELERVMVVIEGSILGPDPNPALRAAGFEPIERVDSWLPDQTAYLVYRRTTPIRP